MKILNLLIQSIGFGLLGLVFVLIISYIYIICNYGAMPIEIFVPAYVLLYFLLKLIQMTRERIIK